MENKIDKAERLLRYHRQHVFDAKNGIHHEIAIKRIKASKIWAEHMDQQRAEAEYRASERLLRMWA